MSRLRRILPLALLLGVLGLHSPAQADHTYPDNYWPTNNLIVRLHSSSNWTSPQISAVQGVLDTIEAVPNSDVTFNFNSTNTYNWQDPCNLVPHILIEKVGVGHIGSPGATVIKNELQCGLGSINQHRAARVQVETPNAIYWGDNVPEPDLSDRGMRGILIHEVIHALGFFGGNSHWDEAGHSNWCVQGGGSANWRTMCSTIYNVSGVPADNYSYTLHADDKAYLQWRY